jgi:hypothetical protein
MCIIEEKKRKNMMEFCLACVLGLIISTDNRLRTPSWTPAGQAVHSTVRALAWVLFRKRTRVFER